jgi:hypothetical protein
MIIYSQLFDFFGVNDTVALGESGVVELGGVVPGGLDELVGVSMGTLFC